MGRNGTINSITVRLLKSSKVPAEALFKIGKTLRAQAHRPGVDQLLKWVSNESPV